MRAFAAQQTGKRNLEGEPGGNPRARGRRGQGFPQMQGFQQNVRFQNVGGRGGGKVNGMNHWRDVTEE